MHICLHRLRSKTNCDGGRLGKRLLGKIIKTEGVGKDAKGEIYDINKENQHLPVSVAISMGRLP